MSDEPSIEHIAELEDAYRKLDYAQQKAASLAAKLDDARREIETLRDDARRLQARGLDATREMEAEKDRVRDYMRLVEQRDESLSYAEHERDTLRVERDDARRDIERLTAERDDARSSLVGMTARHDEMLIKRGCALNSLDLARERWDAAIRDRDALANELAELRKLAQQVFDANRRHAHALARGGAETFDSAAREAALNERDMLMTLMCARLVRPPAPSVDATAEALSTCHAAANGDSE